MASADGVGGRLVVRILAIAILFAGALFFLLNPILVGFAAAGLALGPLRLPRQATA